MTPTDPVDLTAALVRCPSVTPEEGGALVLLQDLLEGAGFTCTRVDRGGVSNLFARWGDKGLLYRNHNNVRAVEALCFTEDGLVSHASACHS